MKSDIPETGKIKKLFKGVEQRVKMQKTDLPKIYDGYETEELLYILKEIQSGGTTASQEKILAMRNLVRDYKLVPVHQIPSRLDRMKA